MRVLTPLVAMAVVAATLSPASAYDRASHARRGQQIVQQAAAMPTRGMNLWKVTPLDGRGSLYVVGTHHGLRLGAMRYAVPLIRFLQGKRFTHVFTEIDPTAMLLGNSTDYAGLDTLVADLQALRGELPALNNAPLPDRPWADAEYLAALRNQDFSLYGKAIRLGRRVGANIEAMALDDALYLIARHDRRGARKPLVASFLEDDRARDVLRRIDEYLGLVTDTGVPSGSDDVKVGNQRDIFTSAGTDMINGIDLRAAELRNYLWISNLRVQSGDVQLWIVGASHLPGLLTAFEERGFHVTHIEPESIIDPREVD